MEISTVCGNIREREIVLYGCPEEITPFLESYRKELTIKYAVTDHKQEVKLQQYAKWNVETGLLDNIVLEDELVIICGEEYFGLYIRRLLHLGKREYYDYISRDLAQSMIEEKKILICMGTQLIGQLCVLLQADCKITEDYYIVYFPESELREAYRNRYLEYEHICRWCEIYIRSSCEKTNFYRKLLRKDVFQPHCRMITVADYGFGGYFPQVERNRDKYSDYLIRERDRLRMSYETLFLSRTDQIMENCCLKGDDIDAIVKRITEGHCFSADYVLDYFKQEIERFRSLEVHDDIQLSDFIEQHREENLCRNLNEWNEQIVLYVAGEILKRIGLEGLTFDVEESRHLLEEASGTELLIYPEVREALGMSESLKDKKYRLTTYYSVKYLNMAEYVEYIATQMYKAMDIMQFTGMDQNLMEE